MRNIIIIFTLFSLLISCSKSKSKIKSKTSASDSISYYFSKYNNNNLRDHEKIEYLNKVKSIILSSENSNTLRELNYDLISKYYEVKSWEDYKIASKVLLKNSLSANDLINTAKSYRSFGNYYLQTQQPDSAFSYYTKSEKIYLKLKDDEGISTILSKKGLIQFNAGDYLGADLSFSKALVVIKKLNDNQKRYSILIQLGLNSNQLKEYYKSIDYFNEALDIVRKNNLKNNYEESVCLSNIGLIYQNLKDHSRAMFYFDQSLRFDGLKEDFPVAYSNIIDNLGYSKLQKKDLKDLPNLFFESLEIRKKLQDTSAMVISYIHISEYYSEIKDDQKALKYANLALSLAKSNKNPIDLLYSLKQASVVDNDQAANYSDYYLRITDSLQIAERNSKDRFAKIQLETNEIIEENEGLAEKNRNLLYVFVVTFILVVLLFVVRAQRARTRELLYKQAQQKANEDIYNLMMSQQAIIDESRSKEKKRLAQDLHDGVLGRMFGLRLNLDSLNSNNDEEAVQKRFELLNELKTIEQDIREISHDLNREKQVLINNFVSIVHNLLEEQKNAFDAEVSYTIDNNVNWDKIGNAIKINLYRILQEGLQNINKYANAKNIFVEIKGDEENVYLKIKDDGIGFDVNKKSKGIGMQNMISRTHDCKGIIDITSKKDEGTKIVITIPIETNQPLIIPQE